MTYALIEKLIMDNRSSLVIRMSGREGICQGQIASQRTYQVFWGNKR